MPEHIHLLISEPERTAPLKPTPGLNGPPPSPLKPTPGLNGPPPSPLKPTPGLNGPPPSPLKPTPGLNGAPPSPLKPKSGLNGAPDSRLKPTPGLNGAPDLADALKSLKQGVARRLIGDADHFWQKRYYDFNVRNHAQFVEKLHYIHWNPVKKGLCERPEDWPWSSFLHHATGGEGRVEIESEWTARQRERAAGRLCPAIELPHSSQNQA